MVVGGPAGEPHMASQTSTGQSWLPQRNGSMTGRPKAPGFLNVLLPSVTGSRVILSQSSTHGGDHEHGPYAPYNEASVLLHICLFDG